MSIDEKHDVPGAGQKAPPAEDVATAAPVLSDELNDVRAQAADVAAPDPRALARKALRTSWPYAAGTAVVLIVAGAVFGGRGSWGNVPMWVLAVTTLLAFVAAAFAALVTYELLRIESRRVALAVAELRQREEAQCRAQAARVAAWYGRWSSVVKGPGMTADPREWRRWGAIISNASDLPVYNVRVSFCVAVDPSAGLTWRQGERFAGALRLVPPGEEHIEMPDHLRTDEEASGNQPTWLVAIQFTDAFGARWLRDPQGRLEPADADPAGMVGNHLQHSGRTPIAGRAPGRPEGATAV
jgi:hypothetical protein